MTLRRETKYIASLGTQASALYGLQLFGFRDLLGYLLFIDALCPILVNQIASFSLVNFVLPQSNEAVLDLVLLILIQETWSVSSAMGLRLHIKLTAEDPTKHGLIVEACVDKLIHGEAFRLEEKGETNIFNLVEYDFVISIRNMKEE
jgi:hypothetical protein